MEIMSYKNIYEAPSANVVLLEPLRLLADSLNGNEPFGTKPGGAFDL